MKAIFPAAPEFTEPYAALLEAYALGEEEATLSRAYEWGRHAVEEGVSLLDLIMIHHAALEAILQREGEVGKRRRVITAAGAVLRESLAAYEMFHRSVQEAHASLRLLNAALEARAEQARQAEEVARQAEREADRANLAKSEFLSRMSHELRTPLNAILGFAQLLEMDTISLEQREGVEQILKGGRHLLGLINEVLDISRIESGRLSLSVEPVSLAEVLAESLDLVHPLLPQHAIQLEANIENVQEEFVLADRQRLKQVLLNLLSNAIKYNREGGAIRLTCRLLPDARIRVTVTDTGPGIPPDRLARLFQPFDRLGAEMTAIEGSGLGLAVSKAIIEAMGGAVGVESTPGQGTAFWIDLARSATPVGDAAALEDELLAIGDSVAARTVLYVENNPSNLKLIASVLARRPSVTLIPALDGRSGLDLARQHRPDLILLDLNLPDLDGDKVLARLRADPALREIPVVIVSADATLGQRSRLLAAGAKRYLSKPLDLRQLLRVIDEVPSRTEV